MAICDELYCEGAPDYIATQTELAELIDQHTAHRELVEVVKMLDAKFPPPELAGSFDTVLSADEQARVDAILARVQD